MNAETIWAAARDRNGDTRDRRLPSAGIRAVLLALTDGPAHGSEIARRADQSQPNVTAQWLPKLFAFGFVVFIEVDPGEVKPGKLAGGRTSRMWKLTRAGRELVAALQASPCRCGHPAHGDGCGECGCLGYLPREVAG